MISININGQFLNIKSDSKLGLSIKSGLFSNDAVAGSLSYDFEIPFSIQSHNIFGYAFDEKAYTIGRKFPAQIFLGGNPWKDAILTLNEIKESYQCSLAMDAGIIKQTIASSDLSKIGIPPIQLSPGTTNEYPYIRLKLNAFLAGSLAKLKLYRNIAGTPTLKDEYQVLFQADKTTTLNWLAYQINNPAAPSWQHVSIPKFDSSEPFLYPGLYFYRSTFPVGITIYPYNAENSGIKGKYFMYRNQINKFINTPSRVDDIIGTLFNPNGQNFFPDIKTAQKYTQVVPYSEVNEPLANPFNTSDLRATVFGDEILIEDLSNANPYPLASSVDYGLYFTEVDSATGAVVDGISAAAIAKQYKDTNALAYPEAKFVCAPVKNDTFFNTDESPEFEGYQNNYDQVGNLIVNSNADGEKRRTAYTCFPYNTTVLDTLFASLNLRLVGFFHTDAEIRSLCIWNNYNNETILVDEDDDTKFTSAPTTYIDLNQNLKGIKTTDYLYGLIKKFGVVFVFRGKGLVEAVLKDTIALSTDMDDWSAKEIVGADIKLQDTIEGFHFKPQKSSDDYFSSIIKDFSDKTFSATVNTIEDLLAIVDDPIDTYRAVLPLDPDRYKSVYRCVYKSNFNKTWLFQGKMLDGVIEADGSIEVDSDLEIPLMQQVNETDLARPHWKIPHVDTKGRSDFDTTDENKPAPLKLMFYRGLQLVRFNPTTDALIPIVSTVTNAGYDGLYSLMTDKEEYYYDGGVVPNSASCIYPKFWKNWVDLLLNARQVEKKFRLNILDLLTLDLTRKKYANGKTYLIEQIDVELGSDTEVVATCLCWRL